MIELTEFVKNKNRFIVAHRGASGEFPENTLIAFEKSLLCGARMIEADIQITADLEPIVFHDEELGRTAPGSGAISQIDYNDLRNLSAGSWFSRDFENEKIPRLEELLEILKGRAYLLLEIKPAPNLSERIKAILKVIIEYNYINYSVFASFDYSALKTLKEICPHCHTAAVKLPDDARLPSTLRAELGIEAYICSIEEINDDISRDILESDIFLGVYSIDTPEIFREALNLPIQAFGTNFPCMIAKEFEDFNSYRC